MNRTSHDPFLPVFEAEDTEELVRWIPQKPCYEERALQAASSSSSSPSLETRDNASHESSTSLSRLEGDTKSIEKKAHILTLPLEITMMIFELLVGRKHMIRLYGQSGEVEQPPHRIYWYPPHDYELSYFHCQRDTDELSSPRSKTFLCHNQCFNSRGPQSRLYPDLMATCTQFRDQLQPVFYSSHG